MAGIILVWLLAFDFSPGASPGLGTFAALIASIASATGAGDFRVKEFFAKM